MFIPPSSDTARLRCACRYFPGRFDGAARRVARVFSRFQIKYVTVRNASQGNPERAHSVGHAPFPNGTVLFELFGSAQTFVPASFS
jgi:hypothetical protein